MPSGTVRKITVLESLCVFALIMVYIWELRYSHKGAWVAILAIMVISHLARHERAAGLGFRAAGLRDCWHEFAPVLGIFALLVISAGMLFQTARPLHVDQVLLAWAGYLPWGLFQQYILNGYFMQRFEAALSPRSAPLAAAAVFSGAHTPNWFLMAVTLVAGYCAARAYRRYRNLYFLGLAHGTIGILLFLFVPDSLTHHLTVGPGWFLR
jgi:hypothetical protein